MLQRAEEYERHRREDPHARRIAEVEDIARRYLQEAAVPLLKEVVIPASYMQRSFTPDQLREYSSLMTLLAQDLGDHHWRYTQFFTGDRPNDPAEMVHETIDNLEAFMNRAKVANPGRMRALDQLRNIVDTEEISQVVDAMINGRGPDGPGTAKPTDRNENATMVVPTATYR